MAHELNLAEKNRTYRENPQHIYTVVDGELVLDTSGVCTLYQIGKLSGGATQIQELKGIVVYGYSDIGELLSCQFVPLLFIRNMAQKGADGKYLSETATDDLGRVLEGTAYPVYETDEYGHKQYYGFGRAVSPTPGELRWGCVWTDSTISREEVLKKFLLEEENLLLDGYRPQHVLERNIDMLGRALNNSPMPPYIPTQTG